LLENPKEIHKQGCIYWTAQDSGNIHKKNIGSIIA